MKPGDKMPCTGCLSEVTLTSKVLDTVGERIQTIIPDHNPVPGNPKGLSVMQKCPGSGKEIGPVITRKVKRAQPPSNNQHHGAKVA